MADGLNGLPSAAAVWRGVYQQAAAVAEGRTQVLLQEHAYLLHRDHTHPSDPGSGITLGEADARYVNVPGDTMTGSLAITPVVIVDANHLVGPTSPAFPAGGPQHLDAYQMGVQFGCASAVELTQVAWYRSGAGEFPPPLVELWDAAVPTPPAAPLWSTSALAPFTDTDVGWKTVTLPLGGRPSLAAGGVYILAWHYPVSTLIAHTNGSYTPVPQLPLSFQTVTYSFSGSGRPANPSGSGALPFLDFAVAGTQVSPIPASQGALRLANAAPGEIHWRNAANTGDNRLGVDAGDQLYYNGSGLLTTAAADPLYLSPTEGDARYLQVTGGTLTGSLAIGSAGGTTAGQLFGTGSPTFAPALGTLPTDYELGGRFTTSTSVRLSAVRWYRVAASPTQGTPTAFRLWSAAATGSPLWSTTTITDSGTVGWQTTTLAAGTGPTLSPGVTYTISYGKAASPGNFTWDDAYTPVPSGVLTWGGSYASASGAIGTYPTGSSPDSFGIDALVETLAGGPVATAGALRLPNGSSGAIEWRNAATTADLPLTVDSSNALTFNGVALTTGGLTQTAADARYLQLAGGTLVGSVLLGTTNLYDLASTTARLRKVWTTDLDASGTVSFASAPTVGGSALLTQTTADALFLTPAEGNAAYALTAHTHDTAYVQLTGGSVMTGLLGPTTTNTRDLGTTTLRWRKLWAVDADLSGTLNVAGAAATFTNAPTVGGSSLLTQTAGDARYTQGGITQAAADLRYEPIDTMYTKAESDARYLQLTGGTVSGALTASSTLSVAGLTTMRADAVVRDALQFGEQGTALAPDVTLARTSAGALRLDTHLGLGTAPTTAWASGAYALQLGALSSLYDRSDYTQLANNSYTDGTDRALLTGLGVKAYLYQGTFTVATAPSVGQGGAQTFTPRAAVSAAGLLSLTPAASTEAINVTGATGTGATIRSTTSLTFAANSSDIYFSARNSASGGFVQPALDNVTNLGAAGARWGTVYASVGTISTSSADGKEHIRDFGVDDVVDALRVLRVRRFDYKALPDWEGGEPPEEALLRKNQIGFISEEAPALFTLGDDRSVSPQQTAVLGLAGLKALLAKIDAHEVRLDALEAGD